MSQLLQSIDDRTRLAGTNRMEILLFSLGPDRKSGRNEVFGINVFKVREVMHIPEITRAPDMPRAVEGMVNLRGHTLPVINLIEYCGIDNDESPSIMIVTEYNKNIQGLLVKSVDNIERLAWEDVKQPPPILDSRHGSLVTAVTELEGRGLVMIMDVEKVLAETAGVYQDDNIYRDIPTLSRRDVTVLYADDSGVARDQIERTMTTMGLRFIGTSNGMDAWERLNQLHEQAVAANQPITSLVNFVLTDIEMPEMDGYVLTRKLKEDDRFSHIPVIMHSSLSAEANHALGKSVGADAYVAKFKPRELACKIIELLEENDLPRQATA